jgi:hypothetical protein
VRCGYRENYISFFLHVLLILDKILNVLSLVDLPARKFGGVPKETEIKERGENWMYMFKMSFGIVEEGNIRRG